MTDNDSLSARSCTPHTFNSTDCYSKVKSELGVRMSLCAFQHHSQLLANDDFPGYEVSSFSMCQSLALAVLLSVERNARCERRVSDVGVLSSAGGALPQPWPRLYVSMPARGQRFYLPVFTHLLCLFARCQQTGSSYYQDYSSPSSPSSPSSFYFFLPFSSFPLLLPSLQVSAMPRVLYGRVFSS